MIDPHFPSLIEIKDYSILGWGVIIFAHDFTGDRYRIGKVTIEENCNVGGYTAIRWGVNIGKNANVAAMSIIFKDIKKDYYMDTAIVLNKALTEINKDEI